MKTIWTVIFHREGYFQHEVLIASRNAKSAYNEVSQKFPERDVVALVPGQHPTVKTFSINKSSADCVSVPCHDNTPTGGSD